MGLRTKKVLKGQYQEFLIRNPGGSGLGEERVQRKGYFTIQLLCESPGGEPSPPTPTQVRLRLPLIQDTGIEPLLYTRVALDSS